MSKPVRRSRSAMDRSPRRPVLAAIAVLASLLTVSCDTESNPVAAGPEQSETLSDETGSQLLTGGTHVIAPSVLELVSRNDSIGGIYRFRVTGSEAPEIKRDDFIVGEDDDVYLRRVLQAERDGDELRLETSLAYWHEVIEDGTYSETSPIAATPDGPARHNPLGLSAVMDLPPSSVPLNDRDICFLTDSLLSQIPGNIAPSLCNEERDFTVGAGVVKVTVDGTITEIFVDQGFVEVTGTIGMSTTIDKGGLIGGERPIFSPCNRGNYPGCLTTPTGAAFIDFIRQYAPQIPDGSLAPNRVCIPLTPIRIRAGYWVRPGFPQLPYWVPPVFELCRVANIGELPSIELPSLEEFNFTPMPNIKGKLVMDVKGKGGLKLQIIPGPLGATAGAKFGDKIALIGSVGLFLTLDIDMAEAGVRVAVDFDEGLAIATRWTDDAGWTRNVEVTKTNLGGSLDPIGPDSVRVRAGITAQITGEACAAIIGRCELDEEADTAFSLAIGAQLDATIFRFLDSQWSRTETDNWKLDTDAAYELDLGVGLSLPLVGMLFPDFPLDWDPDPYDFWRFDLQDMYGTGRLEVVTNTTGPSPDSDGYEVVVERVDTFPSILDPDSERLGPALDWGFPIRRDLENNGSRSMFALSPPPCTIVYSDSFLAGLPPLALAAISLARRLGIGPPNYGLASPCLLLIAEHRVRLEGVAENCSVVGGATQTVALEQRNIIEGRSGQVQAVFDVVCEDPPEPLGSLNVSTTFTGSDPDTSGYTVSIDASPAGSIGGADTRLFGGLTPGSRPVSIADVEPNCTVVSPNPVTVDVPVGGSADVTFDVSCEAIPTPQGAVRVSLESSGPSSDPDGFAVRMDGTLLAVLDGSGSVNLNGPVGDEMSVLHIGDVAEQCRVNGLSPTTVTLDPIEQTASAPFDVSCTDEPITWATGSIFVQALPTRTPAIRMDDESVLRLRGELASELLQMSGVRVAVRGIQIGGSLDLYGYTLDELPEGPSRRTGILVTRGTDYWLFGEEAIQLDGLPSRLADQVGRLVWITGNEVGGRLVPDFFGIIREGR